MPLSVGAWCLITIFTNTIWRNFASLIYVLSIDAVWEVKGVGALLIHLRRLIICIFVCGVNKRTDRHVNLTAFSISQRVESCLSPMFLVLLLNLGNIKIAVILRNMLERMAVD